MKILYITARFPLPPVKGDKLRAFQTIRYLSRNHEIDLVSFIKKSEEIHVGEMKKFCRNVETVPFSPLGGLVNIARNFFTDKPFQALFYESGRMKQAILASLKNNSYDAIIYTLLRMAENLPENPPSPLVADLIDSMVLNFTRRYERENPVLKPLIKEEIRRLEKYENSIVKKADRVLLVSERDLASLNSQNVSVIPIGIDTDDFRPDALKKEKGKIIFTGNLHYFPNVDAVRYFILDILPLIMEEIPEAYFEAAGINPSRKIMTLSGLPGVKIAGYVPDMADFINTGAVYVCPIRCGSGMQIKLLEAMACGAPVVSTSYAAEGIKAVPGVHFLRADSKEEFADKTIQMLKDFELREKIAAQALQLIKEHYTWEAAGKLFEDTLLGLSGGKKG
jgi:sugar transferase (PEP-CTERM/EpsH1 system associated)